MLWTNRSVFTPLLTPLDFDNDKTANQKVLFSPEPAGDVACPGSAEWRHADTARKKKWETGPKPKPTQLPRAQLHRPAQRRILPAAFHVTEPAQQHPVFCCLARVRTPTSPVSPNYYTGCHTLCAREVLRTTSHTCQRRLAEPEPVQRQNGVPAADSESPSHPAENGRRVSWSGSEQNACSGVPEPSSVPAP